TADNVKRFFKSIAIESNPTDVFEQFNPQTDEIHNAEITLVQNNRRYYYILSKNNIYERAQYAGSIIILTDITDNQQAKKMQMELEAAMVAENEANERFRIMLDSMPLICNLWSKEYRVFDCNEAALKLYDMKDKKEYMEKFLDLTPEIQPDGRTTVNLAIDVLNKAFSEGSCSFEYLSKKLDGTIIPMGVTLIRVMYKDDYIVVSYGRDLREQKRMTAEIYETAARLEIAVEEAHEANRAKSNFLSQMSHEIRTPLNAITGMTRIGKNAADTERKNYAFDKIKDASTHLLGIINDILDMSKIEANKLELSDENFIFEKMIERIMGFIGFRVEEKCQRLNVNIGGDIPKCLLGDDHRLAQVITNLLANAVKFTPELGSIDFDARLLEDADGFCTIQFTIKDTGIGISDEQQKHLFDPFHQAESSTTRKYGGTGLGLSISKSIVEIMGGRLWVESEPGKGSTFIFTVKMARGMAEITDAGQSQADSGLPDAAGLKGRRILLAEDLEINREIVTSLLEPVQVIVDCAENGAEAVRMFSRSPEQYDLIFMDVQMPEMDGNGATRAIRALDVPNAKTIPIIAMTANVFREDVQECLQSGMNDHIGKPVDPNELLKKLRDYMKIVDKNEKGRL
ncbi:MAG: response regulator, partial [Chitinispirillales bacterium]|nr:response regulator [Chitinispirillales bacterium]